MSVSLPRDPPPDRLGFFSEDDQRGRFGQRFLLAQQLLLELLDPFAVRLGLLSLVARPLRKMFVRFLTSRPPRRYGLVPPYYHRTKNVGLFLSERRSFGAFDLEFALRKDWRDMRAPAPNFLATFDAEYKALFAEWYGNN